MDPSMYFLNTTNCCYNFPHFRKSTKFNYETPPPYFHLRKTFNANRLNPSANFRNRSNHGRQLLLHHHHHSLLPCSRIKGRRSVWSSSCSTGTNKNTDSAGDDDHRGNDESQRALDIVLRLYSALKRRDLQQVSDLLCDECLCMSNFVSGFKLLRGKQQVMEFFSSLIRSFGNNFEFIIEPIMLDGMNIGVQWKLECSKTHAPLGRGFSFYTCHEYKGKIVIRNMEIFMQPLLHMEPVRLKFMRFMATIVNFLGIYRLFNVLPTRRAVYIIISLVLIAAFVFLKHSS